jgi:hypothetical protein
VDDKIPWSFTCKLCGEDCVLEVPVIQVTHVLKMPPCPVQPRERHHGIQYNLWERSPSGGLISTHIEGTVRVIQGSSSDDSGNGDGDGGGTIAEFSISADIR